MQDEHVWEALGKARIVVRDGKVVEVGEPQLKYCPIFDKFRGIKELTCDAIRENMQFRIEDFGMCRADRKLYMRDYLSFGVSEMMHTAMEKGMIDAAVIVCEGCGTVVIDEPDMVQGIGGRVSGLVSTTPIPELIKRLGPEKVLDPSTAKIDQVAGVNKAIAMGYKNIAVSTAGAANARDLRKLEKEHPGVNIYIFVVHTSGMTRKDAEAVFDNADIATGCASKNIRGVGEERETHYIGESVPIFGITERGRKFIEERIKAIGKKAERKPGAKQPDKLL
jgi:putative methanogenesis marker protein 8